MHYNDVFKDFWVKNGYKVVYQPCCLTRPYDSQKWPIQFPKVEWTDRTIVIMHCQDFVSINHEGCPELKTIEDHFGENSNRVIVVHWNYDLSRVYSGPLNLIYFPTHSYEILCNLAGPKYQGWKDAYTIPRTRNWQCLNGVPRQHRRAVHSWIKSLPNGMTCLSDIDPLPQDAYHDVYTWSDPDITDNNEINFIRLSWLYATTKINIITETQYLESPGIISEKTLLALLACQVPIVIGYRGIVDDCRRIGFDMFDDLVDTSYDQAPDIERWRLALELNKELMINPPDLAPYQKRLIDQREWVLNSWPNEMIFRYNERSNEILHLITKI